MQSKLELYLLDRNKQNDYLYNLNRMKNTRYKRSYISGCGTEYNDGIVEVTMTEKTTVIRQIEKPILYASWLWNKKKDSEEFSTIRIKGKPKVYDDGSFVIYHNRAGTPFIYNIVK